MRGVFIAILLVSGYFASAQSSSTLDQTLTNLQKQAFENPFEKVYLHLDKPYYGAGDTIWFKGYVVVGQQHHLTATSYVLNVDLINQDNAILKSLRLPMVAGVAYGDFILPDTLEEGSYRIRAYTNWMRNAGDEYFFDKTLNIVNALKNRVFTESSYSYVMQNGQQTVNALVNYKDIDGKPVANREVKYEILLGVRHIAKGKGITDEKGGLQISFNNPLPEVLNSGQINTDIALDYKTSISKVILIKSASPAIDVQFFPESGNLINGVTSKVAFKGVGSDGSGVDIKGSIVDDQNNTLASFSSTHLGMGAFMLTPQAGKTYKAHIIFADGTQSTVELPKALNKGYVLSVNNADTLNNVTVQISGAQGNENGSLVLVAQAGGELYFEGKSKPGQASFTVAIPKNRFPSGIVQFTLFSDSGEPLNERLVFIQNPDKLNIAVNTDKATYQPRQKVQVRLNIRDKLNQPVQGNFSAAVINESVVPVDETAESTILSNILLTSDIKGYIEKPNYYFTNSNKKTATDLDVLMLTQGYHRFEWKQLAAGNANPDTYKPEKALTIAGTIKTSAGKPVPNAKVTLINIGGGFFTDTVADKDGRFTFNMNFADSVKFTIKALKANGGSNVVIEMDKVPFVTNRNKNTADIAINVNKGLEGFLQNSKRKYDEDIKYGMGNHSILLKEVNINHIWKSARQIAQEKAVEYSSNLNGPGNANQIVTADEIEHLGGTTLFERLAGVLAGIQIMRDTNGVEQAYSERNSRQMNSLALPMRVIIDGVFGRDVNAIDVNSIASVEVLRSAQLLSVYGSRASTGIIIITTIRGAQESDKKYYNADGNVIPSYVPQGYYKAREFYSPRYDAPQQVKKAADLRSTISWNPFIETDKDGNASFEYFNADGKGNYRVVVEGIDYKSGTLGRQVYRYKVE